MNDEAVYRAAPGFARVCKHKMYFPYKSALSADFFNIILQRRAEADVLVEGRAVCL
jgi:hypothetical protein